MVVDAVVALNRAGVWAVPRSAPAERQALLTASEQVIRALESCAYDSTPLRHLRRKLLPQASQLTALLQQYWAQPRQQEAAHGWRRRRSLPPAAAPTWAAPTWAWRAARRRERAWAACAAPPAALCGTAAPPALTLTDGRAGTARCALRWRRRGGQSGRQPLAEPSTSQVRVHSVRLPFVQTCMPSNIAIPFNPNCLCSVVCRVMSTLQLCHQSGRQHNPQK
jgi:hypothetical protein